MPPKKFVLLMNFRLSERHFNGWGNQLDLIEGQHESERRRIIQALLASGTIKHTTSGTSPAKFTAIMHKQFESIFGNVFQLKMATEDIFINLNIEKYNCLTKVEDLFAFYSENSKAAGVEGDDLIFCIILRDVHDQPGNEVIDLNERPQSYLQAAELIRKCLPAMSLVELESSKFEGLPGFYLLDEGKWIGNDAFQVQENTEGYSREWNFIISLICSYLFYCWLICQRAERLLNQISFEGDKDVEVRKLILTRKKIVAGMRYALLKNRMEPDSLALPIFFHVLQSFRLEEQLNNLSHLSEEAQKAVELQENYLSAARLQKIQWILFVFSIFSLGIALNAIQMPPFYISKTKNILVEYEFWIVFIVVMVGSLLLWECFHNGKRAGKFLTNSYKRLTYRLRKK
jgi:hypothetical protein